jgi:hypothetical protein
LSEPERLGAVLGRSDIPRPGKKQDRLELLAVRWETIAGERLAAHCGPSSLTRGTLTISADGSAWATEAGAGATGILRRIEVELGRGAVKRIKVRARAPAKEPEVPPGRVPEEPEPPPEELGRIKDERLREAVHRMLRASRSSKQNEQGD